MAILSIRQAGACFLVLALTCSTIPAAVAQDADGAEPEQRTRQAEAVRLKVYEKIKKSEELIDADDIPGALELLEDLLADGKLSDYEKGNVLTYIGVTRSRADDTAGAISAFEELLAIDGLEGQMRTNAVYTLAQLSAMAEDFETALGYLEQWFALTPSPSAQDYVRYAQYLYQVGRYDDMIKPIRMAISVAESNNKPAREDWYVLLNFAYFQQEDYKSVRDIQTTLLEQWPRKRYWMSLAGAYTELGDENSLFAAFDAAHTQGLLETESELVTMAQLYLQHEIPYKAARLLEEELASGRITGESGHYRLLSQAWTLAQEDEKAVPALVRAASLSGDGELYTRLGNAYLNLGQHGDCVAAVKTGLERGGIRSPDYAYISLGMCLYNLGRLREAIDAFHEAAKSDRSTRTATQWIQIIRAEIKRLEIIADTEAATREQVLRLRERQAAGESG